MSIKFKQKNIEEKKELPPEYIEIDNNTIVPVNNIMYIKEDRYFNSFYNTYLTNYCVYLKYINNINNNKEYEYKTIELTESQFVTLKLKLPNLIKI